jgi:hypothetical protein
VVTTNRTWQAERADVVEWLRAVYAERHSGDGCMVPRDEYLLDMADAIERGEHEGAAQASPISEASGSLPPREIVGESPLPRLGLTDVSGPGGVPPEAQGGANICQYEPTKDGRKFVCRCGAYEPRLPPPGEPPNERPRTVARAHRCGDAGLVNCARCHRTIIGGEAAVEFCWWCHARLCWDCWDDVSDE